MNNPIETIARVQPLRRASVTTVIGFLQHY
jgi:hypothetical protein